LPTFILKKIVGLITNQLMLRKYCLLTVFILLQFCSNSQTMPGSSYVDIAAIKDSALIADKALIFFDSNNTATFKNLTQQNFVPLNLFINEKKVPPRLVPKHAYLQIALFNGSNTKDTVYFFPGINYDKIFFYEKTPGGNLKFYSDASAKGFGSLALAPIEKKVFIIKLVFCRHDYNDIKPQLINLRYFKTYKAVYENKAADLRGVGFLVSGMLFLMLLFIIVNYFLSFKKEFLYYLGYAVCMFFLVYFYAQLRNSWGSFTSFFNGYLDLFLLMLGNIFYLAFSRYFLDTKNNYQLLDTLFKVAEWFLIAFLLGFTLTHYFTNWYLMERLLENLMKFAFLSIGIIFIVIAFKQKNRLIIYLAVGSAFSIIFSGISLALILLKIPTTGIFNTALFYHEIGLLFALAFFLLGLTYKNRKELIGRIKEQEALKLDVEKKDFENQIAVIKAQQEERNRISADMHDDLGAGMTTIRLYSELAKSRLGDKVIPEIEKISSSANELLEKMNAIIWSMSSSNDSLGNMIAYIRSYSLEYFENTGINCHITLPENLPNIVVSGAIRRNIFLVVKESLNNIVKHSGATEVHITLVKVPHGLKLFIQDNGKGINFEKLHQFGNGLKNMKKRMDDLGIDFTIENSNGTLVTLHGVIVDF
jgi:signal transduction histidine kinase